jgi:hypothetical protein
MPVPNSIRQLEEMSLEELDRLTAAVAPDLPAF